MRHLQRSRLMNAIAAVVLLGSVVPAPALAESPALVYDSTLPVEQEFALASATGVCVQPGTEKVFVVDKTAKAVHRFSSDGAVHEAVWSDAGGEAFVEPSDVAADTSGNIYVADAGRGYVYKLNAVTGALVTKLGSGLVDAVGIDWFSSGGQEHIYVADKARGRVLRFGTSSDTSTGYEFDGGGALFAPEDVAVTLTGDGLLLWIADSVAHKVTCLNWMDGVQTSWGTTGTAEGQLTSPKSVDVRGDGSVLVADADRVQRFSQGGVYLAPFLASGTAAGQVLAPQRLSVDQSNDHVWVADSGNGRAQRVDSTGAFVAQFGSGPGVEPGRFRSPRHIDVAPDGALWVADTMNHRIQRLDASGAVAFGEQGSGSGQFNAPWAVAADASGDVYVADTLNDRIQKLDASGTVLAVWGTSGAGPGQFDEPKAIAVDAQGFIYVADTGNWRVQKLDPSGGFVAAWTSYGSPERFLYRPADIAIGPEGHVFVFDGFNERIVEFRSDGTVVRVWGDAWSPGYEFVGSWSGIDVSDTGNVYVADWMNLRVHAADDGPAGMVYKTLVSGTGPGEAREPSDIAVGPFGTVWVCDTALHRVQRYTLPDTTPPFTNRMGGAGEWSYSSGETVYVMRPTDWPAGPLETWASVNNGEPQRIWDASREDTVSSNIGFYLSEEGENRLDYWSVDGYGNREETNTAWVRIDRTWPEATWTVEPSGWTTAAAVTASLTATDAPSGVATRKCFISGATENPTGASQFDYAGPITITNEGQTNLYAEVRDKAGLAVSRGNAARIDRTPPSTYAWDSNPGSTDLPRMYWLMGTDTHSGVATTYYRVEDAAIPSIGTQVSFSVPGTYTVEYWSVDYAGNAESAQTTELVVPDDGSPPDATRFEIENNDGWTNKTDARAFLEATGATRMRFSSDGVTWTAWRPYSSETTVTLPNGEGTFDMRAQFADESLSVADELWFGIAIDRTPPVTNSNKDDLTLWTPPAQITFSPDDGGGSGSAGTFYRLDGGDAVGGFSCTTSVPGTHTIEFWSVDIAGNEESHQNHEFKVAEPPKPTTTAVAASATLVNYGGRVTVYGRTRDASSAIVSEGEVTLWTRAYGSSTWYKRDTAGWDPVSQRHVASTTLAIGSYVQMRFGGTVVNAASDSSALFVRARAKVGNPVAPSTAYRSRAFTTYGSLYPSHAKGTPVRIYKYRYVSGAWKYYGYVTAKTIYANKYSVSMSLPYSGKWRLRAYHADGGHYGSYSAGYDYVTVR